MPVVDVLLPVRDAAATVAETLADLRAQTLTDFRCWILDDGSRDGSAEIARREVGSDPRFTVVPLPARGIVPTLNDGIARAASDLVARMDADDRCAPERLERQVAWLADHPGDHLVSCGVSFFGDVSENLRAYESWLNGLTAHEDIVRDLFVEAPFAHPSVVVRTAALRHAGGYREEAYPEDYDLWLRGWRLGWRFAKVPGELVRLRQHEGRLTWTDDRYTARAFLECKVEHLVAEWQLAGRDVIVWGAGRDGKRAAKALRRRGVGVRFLVDIAPTKIGRSMLGVEVRPMEALRRKADCPLVVSVGVKGARAEIREALAGWGYSEGTDFVCFG